MLKTLSIRNFTLIKDIELDFSSGLNIITGETGAGKSIVVDALMLALGERASSDLVRNGESKAIIEATFELPSGHPVFKLFDEISADLSGNQIITRRELLSRGTSRCFINDSPVQLSNLKLLGDYLVDFHGQHDHQMLLRQETHIGILDSILNSNDLLEDYRLGYSVLRSAIENYQKLMKKDREMNQKLDSYRFELDEIKKINPLPDEESGLENELNVIENSEVLFNISSELYSGLYDIDDSVYSRLTGARKLLDQLRNIDTSFNEYYDEFSSSIISIAEISKFIGSYRGKIQYDRDRIEQIRERLTHLKALRKKYGTMEAALSRKQFLEEELALIDNFDEELKRQNNEITAMKKQLGQKAQKLSEIRMNKAKYFEEGIDRQLQTMGIENSRFEVVFRDKIIIDPENSKVNSQTSVIVDGLEYSATANGVDDLEFYISTNKGSDTKPLANIASGGEISRVMLSIKSILADSENLPILIFDEIDVGISGRIAQRVGKAMKSLARRSQVIAITHLAQIAALGEKNILVKKQVLSDETFIQAKEIRDGERLHELAKLISGEDITEAALNSIRELSLINSTDDFIPSDD
jgi:DNA repair protein RecN (Recombination protein N)